MPQLAFQSENNRFQYAVLLQTDSRHDYKKKALLESKSVMQAVRTVSI
jgi:hypothetical protein